MAAGRFRRRPDEIARKPEVVPPELECFAGPCGPYIATDKAEFHHAAVEAQQWFIRQEPADILDIRYAVRLAKFVRGSLKWANRIFWASLGGLGAALTAGEKLAKLPETISGAISGVSGAFQVLRGLFGL